MTDAKREIKAASVFFVKATSTFLGIGYSPFAPGTMGSATGVLLAWFLGSFLFLCLSVLTLLGFLVCKRAVDVLNSEDPKSFVMDEVCGMMISLLWLPKTLFVYVTAFFLFRIFDIIKPWPISRVQRWRNPSAIMWDDVLAGVFANLVIRLFLLIRS